MTKTKNIKPVMCETYYCTIDYPLPATVAATYKPMPIAKGARISTDSDKLCEGMIHVVIHPDATQRAVLQSLRKIRRHVGAKKRIRSSFIQESGGEITDFGGVLHIDEDWPAYVRRPDATSDPDASFPLVLVAISAPMRRKEAVAHVTDVILVIKRDGLSNGVSIVSGKLSFATEKAGKISTETA